MEMASAVTHPAGAMHPSASAPSTSAPGAGHFTVMFVVKDLNIVKVVQCTPDETLRQAATRAFERTNLVVDSVWYFRIADLFTDEGYVQVDDFEQTLAAYTDKDVFLKMKFDVTMKPA